MVKELKAFEKFLQGYKTYLVAIVAIAYGVLESGFRLHHWTSFGGAWTWVFSASGLAAFRAAFATYATNVLTTLAQPPVSPTVVTPTVTPPKV